MQDPVDFVQTTFQVPILAGQNVENENRKSPLLIWNKSGRVSGNSLNPSDAMENPRCLGQCGVDKFVTNVMFQDDQNEDIKNRPHQPEVKILDYGCFNKAEI